VAGVVAEVRTAPVEAVPPAVAALTAPAVRPAAVRTVPAAAAPAADHPAARAAVARLAATAGPVETVTIEVLDPHRAVQIGAILTAAAAALQVTTAGPVAARLTPQAAHGAVRLLTMDAVLQVLITTSAARARLVTPTGSTVV
jgi:hypothetical protein